MLIQDGMEDSRHAISGPSLREDYSAKALRALARRSKDINQSRRLSVAGSGPGTAWTARITAQRRSAAWTARRCATGCIASTGSGPQGLIDNWTEGPKPRMSEQQLAQFAQIVAAGPGSCRRTASCVAAYRSQAGHRRRGSGSIVIHLRHEEAIRDAEGLFA